MADVLLDDFADVAAWLPVASGLARLEISSDVAPRGKAMRLDFDFAGGGGFVVARKELAVRVPESYALCFDIRGTGPANRLELKLSDPSGRNVWWYHQDAFELPADWRAMRIRSSRIEFAWGPAGGGAPSDIGAVEFALAAGPGGRGTVWIANLRLEDLTPHAAPVVRASSALPGHEAGGILAQPPRSWRTAPSGDPAWLEIDFQKERELGGLVVHWEPAGRARAFAVRTLEDDGTWRLAHATAQADADRSYVYMPGTATRVLRLDLEESVAAGGFGITALEVRPFEFSRSIQTFFRAVAADAPRGAYPRYLRQEQTYWTPIGVADGDTCAIMNEEGMVEVDRGTFSIEPFLFTAGRLVTWADAAVTQELEHGRLPIPSSVWRAGGLVLRTTAYAARSDGRPTLFLRYHLENTTGTVGPVSLFLACRPFQVTPPWQAFGDLGGVSPIRALAGTSARIRVNDSREIVPLEPPDGFGAAPFHQGDITEHLRRGALPPHADVADTFGYASGAWRWDLELPGFSSRDVHLAIPFGTTDGAGAAVAPGAGGAGAAIAPGGGAELLESTIRSWDERLGRVTIRLAPAWQHYVDALRTSLAYVLIERDGPALQPGPRRYTRSWIRDGAIMAAALLRMRCADEAKAFVRWYAGYQAPDGNVPCAVDRSGADWLVEHDSHGELIFAVAECFRFTGDRVFLEELWPNVVRAVGYLERLRDTRRGAEFDAGPKRAFRGLLPESASHEGYLAHPVHSYWDDFWAVRALGDAAHLAAVRGDAAVAARLTALHDDFRDSIRTSIEVVIATRAVPYVPGSVEWADFDPTATSNAIALLGEMPLMPRAALEHTFAEYLAGFRRRRRNEIDWANYTAYEVRIIGALVLLGDRAGANELAEFMLGDRRPLAWNEWPEISWRDPRSPGHIGDVPHAWISAEYVLALRTMLAYERSADQALVVAAGIPEAWLDGGAEVVVEDLVTYYGTLGFTLRRVASDALALSVRGDVAPPGGIVLEPPLTKERVTLRTCPAEVVLKV